MGMTFGPVNLIEPAPKIGTRINTDFILGMGKSDGRFIMILDIDSVFGAAELSFVPNAEQQALSA